MPKSTRSTKRLARSPKSLGRQVIDGLREIRSALERGERLEDRFTVRQVSADFDPPAYSPRQISALRRRLNVSQAVFARMLAVSVKTIQAWEQGAAPTPMARRLLETIDRDPGGWLDMLQSSQRKRSA